MLLVKARKQIELSTQILLNQTGLGIFQYLIKVILSYLA